MLPLPTATGLYSLVGCGLLFVLGAALRVPMAVTMAGSGLICIAWAYITTVPIARRVRREQFEFAWWLERREALSGTVVPGAPFDVRCYLRYRGRRDLRVRAFAAVHDPDIANMLPGPRDVIVPARSRTAFRVGMVAHATGRVVLQGFALRLDGPLGLFSAPLYFPNPLTIKVLPRASRSVASALATLTGLRVDRSGLSNLRRRGGGTELHELRDLMPGDPYRAIAWKASARLNKWVVKEVEQEVQTTQWLVVDVSGTMRDGPVGQRKLDHAIELAAALCDRAIHRGDRVGLITTDSRIVSHINLGEGSRQRLRIYEALLDATEVVDTDLTDVDLPRLAYQVASHMRRQDGRDFFMPGSAQVGDVVSLSVEAKRKLRDQPHRAVRAGDEVEELLRAYCRQNGLRLPYRLEPPDGSKVVALSHALMTAAGRRRDPSALYVITDFAAMPELEQLLGTLRFLRGRHHQVEFIWPTVKSPLESLGTLSGLGALHRRADERRRVAARSALAGLGVWLSEARPERRGGAVS